MFAVLLFTALTMMVGVHAYASHPSTYSHDVISSSWRPNSLKILLDTPTITPTNTPDLCAPVWSLVSSPNLGTGHNYLTGVTAVTANNVWAVGYYNNSSSSASQTLVEHWNGGAWSVVSNPNVGTTYNELHGVTAVAANDVWTVGYYYSSGSEGYRTLIEHWDGNTWSIVPSPNVGIYANILYGVTAVAANDVWAVGMFLNGESYQTLIEHWDGSTWSLIPSLNGGANYNNLTAVVAIAANDVWAVGYYITTGYRTLIEHWDGNTWSIVPSPNMGVIYNYLTSITAVSTNDIWAAGYYSDESNISQALTEHWDGSTWSLVPTPKLGAYDNAFSGIAAESANDVWAVGYINNDWGSGETLVEHWDGSTWSVVPSSMGYLYNTNLHGVTTISRNEIWTVGRSYGNSSYQTLAGRYLSPCATSTNTPTHSPTPTLTATSTSTRTPMPPPDCGTGSDYLSEQLLGATMVPGNDLVSDSQCDDCLVPISLPFAVSLYGESFNTVNASANGNLQFLSSNYGLNTQCLPFSGFNYAILPDWFDLNMDPAITSTLGVLGIYTSVTGTQPNRVFNIEWRACRFAVGTCGGNVNFEVRLYEGQDRFDFVYGEVAGSGNQATVGVQRRTGGGAWGSFTEVSCGSPVLQSGLQITFRPQTCPTSTPTPTGTDTATPTITPTPTATATDTGTPTSTPTPMLVGHVNWQGPPAQPNTRQQLPITLTLKLGTTEISYPSQNTNASGFFTVPVTGLPSATYNWRVKGPKYLANAGTVQLTGVAITNAQIGTMRVGDASNDNLVTINDFSILKPAFGRSVGEPGYDDRADFTGDQVVTVTDFNLLKVNFGMGGAPPIRLGP